MGLHKTKSTSSTATTASNTHKQKSSQDSFLIDEPDTFADKGPIASASKRFNKSGVALDQKDPTELILNKMKPNKIFPGHVELSFFGAAGTVTGSKHLLTNGDLNVLVDCGMFQGLKELREKNWEPISTRFAVERECDAIVVTHAHLDHTGYLPRMVRLGYSGPIYMTKETRQLAEIVLLDSAHLQEEDAKYLNKKGITKHTPALPFITLEDVEKTMSLVVEVDYHTPTVIRKQPKSPVVEEKENRKNKKNVAVTDSEQTEPIPSDSSLEFTFFNAGHILGSCYVYVQIRGQKILFSGDLGTMKTNKSLQVTPELPQNIEPDIVLVESTYGDRLLQTTTDEQIVATEDFLAPQLEEAINYIFKHDGICLVPAFSIGRAQVVAYMFLSLMERKKIPRCSVHIDTPMGSKAMNYYIENLEKRTDMSASESKHIANLLSQVHIHETSQSSKQLKMDIQQGKKKCIIISSAGMLTGGRVVHHLQELLPNKENVILISGYQAAGTRGRMLVEGAKKLKIFGEQVPVGAKVTKLSGISAHADAADLMTFLKSFKKMPKTVFVVHGEPESSRTLARAIAEDLKIPAVVPKQGTTYHLVHDETSVPTSHESLTKAAVHAQPKNDISQGKGGNTSSSLYMFIAIAVLALLVDIYLRL